MCWPLQQPNVLVFGLADGKVRAGQLKTNKSATLYPGSSYVVAFACNPEGTAFLGGHEDGSIVRFTFDDNSGAGGPAAAQGLLARHPVAPYALAWGATAIFAAGADRRAVLYDSAGRVLQQFDHARADCERGATVAAAAPSGMAFVAGSFDRLRVYHYDSRRRLWAEGPVREITNFYSVTALAWRADGSRIVVVRFVGFAGSIFFGRARTCSGGPRCYL
jgi:intraflagellar transport protein 172